MKIRRGFGSIAAFAILAIAIYYPYSPVGTQRRNTQLAEQHVAKLRPLLAADRRFRDLDVSIRDLGYVQITCEVASQSDEDALVELVKKSEPPVPVIYRVTISEVQHPTTRSSQTP